jgi:hypothetical protein
MNATFTINAENTISFFPTPDHAEASIGSGATPFTSQDELAKLAADWPLDRLVEIWNGIAGTPGFDKLKPVKKFENRAKAVARIWTAVHVLATDATAAPPATQDAPAEARPTTKAKAAKKPAKAAPAAKKAKAAPAEPKTPRAGTKQEQAIKMLSRKNGATNLELQEAFGWQPHTVRGFIAGALRKKMGLAVENFKRAGDVAAYRIAQK